MSEDLKEVGITFNDAVVIAEDRVERRRITHKGGPNG